MAKKKKNTKRNSMIAGVLVGVFVIAWLSTSENAALKRANTWQQMTSPGDLMAAHASLEENCTACHAPVRGVEPDSCIVCHANNESLLQDQTTSFHANIQSCDECHMEHQGRDSRTLEMDHGVLAKLGLQLLENDDPSDEGEQVRKTLSFWMRHTSDESLPHKRIAREELMLDCTSCHEDEDPHVAYFGNNCADCHGTQAWNIPEYIHPPSASMDCAQCHKAPPSHYMPMFMSMCARMLGKSPDSLSQCYVCHTITAWNDMKDAPWHKKSMSHIPSR